MKSLQEHHLAQYYKPEEFYKNVCNADGNYLGPYIPYIGTRYFDTNPKVLIYAMAQNLARETGQQLIRAWHSKIDKGLQRQYYSIDKIRVHPYDDGHLKVIAALALSEYPGTNYLPSDNIHDRIAVTNFVKFSFNRRGKDNQILDTNPPLKIYDDMWKHYSAYEVDLLQPDIIIGVGNNVGNAIKRNLKRNVILVEIPFPGRLNLNSRYVPEGKRLIEEKGYNYSGQIAAHIKALLKGTPDNDGAIAKAIKTDWYYFKEMEICFREVLTKR